MHRTVPCPNCERANGAHRSACLYCGELLPPPTAAPPTSRRTVPADLDALVNRALAGQASAEDIQSAFSGAGEGALPERSFQDSVQEMLGSLDEPIPHTAHRDVADMLEDARRALDDVERAWTGQLSTDMDDALSSISDTLAELQTAAITLPPPVVLPPFRQPYALAIQPPGPGSDPQRAAHALQVDLATARLVTVSVIPKVVLRGPDPHLLEARAEAWIQAFELPARVISKDTLLRMPSPQTLVYLDSAIWRAVSGEAWLLEADTVDHRSGVELTPIVPELIVLGEVVIQTRLHAGRNERRVRVADLHTNDSCFRAVEGVTRMGESQSASRDFRRWTENLASHFPTATAHGRRVCDVTRGMGPPSADGQPRRQESGWPLFEEHTRICRALAGLEAG